MYIIYFQTLSLQAIAWQKGKLSSNQPSSESSEGLLVESLLWPLCSSLSKLVSEIPCLGGIPADAGAVDWDRLSPPDLPASSVSRSSPSNNLSRPRSLSSWSPCKNSRNQRNFHAPTQLFCLCEVWDIQQIYCLDHFRIRNPKSVLLAMGRVMKPWWVHRSNHMSDCHFLGTCHANSEADVKRGKQSTPISSRRLNPTLTWQSESFPGDSSSAFLGSGWELEALLDAEEGLWPVLGVSPPFLARVFGLLHIQPPHGFYLWPRWGQAPWPFQGLKLLLQACDGVAQILKFFAGSCFKITCKQILNTYHKQLQPYTECH